MQVVSAAENGYDYGAMSRQFDAKHALRLTPNILLSSYAQGIFPMAHQDGNIYWYNPDPRTIIPLDNRFHVPRRLKQTIKQRPYEIRFDTNFRGVMLGCAAPAPGRESTWISDEIIQAYTWLHHLGYAHCVEAWQDGTLVGGLYGVTLRGLYAGESMFSYAKDASKICLVYLIEHLREQRFTLLDTQFNTPHLARFGAIEIPREQYEHQLNEAMKVDARF